MFETINPSDFKGSRVANDNSAFLKVGGWTLDNFSFGPLTAYRATSDWALQRLEDGSVNLRLEMQYIDCLTGSREDGLFLVRVDHSGKPVEAQAAVIDGAGNMTRSIGSHPDFEKLNISDFDQRKPSKGAKPERHEEMLEIADSAFEQMELPKNLASTGGNVWRVITRPDCFAYYRDMSVTRTLEDQILSEQKGRYFVIFNSDCEPQGAWALVRGLPHLAVMTAEHFSAGRDQAIKT